MVAMLITNYQIEGIWDVAEIIMRMNGSLEMTRWPSGNKWKEEVLIFYEKNQHLLDDLKIRYMSLGYKS